MSHTRIRKKTWLDIHFKLIYKNGHKVILRFAVSRSSQLSQERENTLRCVTDFVILFTAARTCWNIKFLNIIHFAGKEFKNMCFGFFEKLCNGQGKQIYCSVIKFKISFLCNLFAKYTFIKKSGLLSVNLKLVIVSFYKEGSRTGLLKHSIWFKRSFYFFTETIWVYNQFSKKNYL